MSAYAKLAPFFAILASWLLCLTQLPFAAGSKLIVPLYAYPEADAWKPLVTTWVIAASVLTQA